MPVDPGPHDPGAGSRQLAPISDREAFHLLGGSNIGLVLSDPTLPDNPLVYVNRAFEKVTGYSAMAALGRNCRFLQGPATDPEDVARIREAVRQQQETTVDLLNYRADGTTFMNRLILSPIRQADGTLTYFMGIQKPLTPQEARNSVNADLHALRELQHRVKNHLAMIAGLIRIESRAGHAPESAARIITLSQRIESLQALYQELSDAGQGRGQDGVSMGAYLARLTGALNAMDGRRGIRVNVEVQELRIDTDVAARVGLMVTEVVTNALKHAFADRDTGCVVLRANAAADGTLLITVTDDGIGIPSDTVWPASKSVGGRVVLGLAAELKATLSVANGMTGTIVTLSIPGVLARD